ncbi:hypothetical protein HELRODRAFT_178509 [Helobdella robusta]|uniref:Methyltransferase domain-containing protein n=1 Tax=Helobdella robusta TaxID=6412 RepID=T1FDA2_HELRO|nr:hypothetical protein HELRODRAFT_178509 [Helobdella robusta]ESN97060.1 hypothetical protein HELRODRAFT_178509 [Helobdella robusta]
MEPLKKEKISYAEAFAEFRKHANLNKVYEGTYAEVEKGYLDHVQHAISIGSGPGINDLTFLKKLTPNLTDFTAVEINKSCLDELSDNLKKFLPRNVNVKIHFGAAQHWKGPEPGESKADLVLMFHALYYFNKDERNVRRIILLSSYLLFMEINVVHDIYEKVIFSK